MDVNKISLIIIYGIIACNIHFLVAKQHLVVCCPIANIKSETKKTDPNLTPPLFYKDIPEQLSQALFNEPLILEKTENDWLHVQVLEQKICSPYFNTWNPLSGVVETEQTIAVENFLEYNLIVRETWSNLYQEPNTKSRVLTPICIGTKLFGEKINDDWVKITLPKKLHEHFNAATCYVPLEHIAFIEKQIEKSIDQIRLEIVSCALLFLENPYVWGHRSVCSDCSGFTNLVYRICGFQIPKNSTSQWKACTPLDGNQMLPGDLIFFAKPETPYKTCHAMLYLGNGNLAECTGLPDVCKTRIVSDVERLGKKIEKIKNGTQSGAYIVYFGTYLSSIETLQERRSLFYVS